MKKILVFGNALHAADSLALKVAQQLKSRVADCEFIECDTSENIEDFGPDLTILDVAFGIEQVVVLDDLKKIQNTKPYSMHDFDLSVTLAILKKIGKLNSIKIIAIPVYYDENKAVEEVASLIKTI